MKKEAGWNSRSPIAERFIPHDEVESAFLYGNKKKLAQFYTPGAEVNCCPPMDYFFVPSLVCDMLPIDSGLP